MRRWVVVRAWAAVMGLAAVEPLCAGVIRYTSEPEFLAAAPIVHTETFDDPPTTRVLGGPTVVVDGMTYTTSNITSMPPASPSFTAMDEEVISVWIIGINFDIIPHASAPNDFGSNLIDDNTLSFGDGGWTPAIGFYLRTPMTFPTPTFQIFVNTTAGETFQDTLSFAAGTSPYRGFLAPEGITSVLVRNDPASSSQGNFSFDNVSRGVVPEPVAAGTLALLASGAFLRRVPRR